MGNMHAPRALKNVKLLNILPLLGIGCSVLAIVVLPYVKTAIEKISASYTADLGFTPSSVQMSTNQVVPVDLTINPNGARVGFAKTVVFFNPSLFQLNSEIDVSSSPLKQLIRLTPMSQANVTGRAEIVQGLLPANKSTPMTATSTIARLNFIPATTQTNQGQLNFVNSEVQIVDMDGTVIQSNSSQAQVVINPLPSTPIPTSTSIATPQPTFSPTPRPSVTPQPTDSPTPRPSVTPQPTYSPTPRPSTSPVPSWTPSPTPIAPIQGNGLIASYFVDKDLTKLAQQRVDARVDFNWLFGRPTKFVGRENFSVRWQGKVQTAEAGTYTFTTRSDDGVRLKVDNVTLINDWRTHGLKENSATMTLPANTLVDITLEYFEGTGVAEVHLLWQTPTGRKTIIPSSSLFVK